MKVILIVGAILFALVALVIVAAIVPPERPSNQNLTAATNLVNELRNTNVVQRFDCASHDAYINPAYWTAFDAEEKQKVAWALATSCAQNGGWRYARVYDNQSGKVLADFRNGDYKVY